MNCRFAALLLCGSMVAGLSAQEKNRAEKEALDKSADRKSLLKSLDVGLAGAADSLEATAAKLAASTVTVRILPDKANYKRSQANAARGQMEPTDGVIVCSGVSVGPGRIVTFASNTTSQSITTARVRVTLPDGEQSEAHLRVVDNYSGLSLLDIKERNVPVLEIAGERPKLGSRVLSAAAGGIEGPTISTGIVAGLNRVVGSTILPPLVQCDLRTTETSSGAAVVDKNARLLGILVITPAPGDAGGWAYAVTAQHVKRLLNARADDKLLVLERRPATLGLTLGPGAKEDTVKVEHVEAGGPAEKAGIKVGDLVLEAEGVKVRSAYQVVGMVLNRQAGDAFNLVLSEADRRKSLDVTLGSNAGGGAKDNRNADAANDRRNEPQQQRAYGGTQLMLVPRGDNSYEVINNNSGAYSNNGIVNGGIGSGGAANGPLGNTAGPLEQQAASGPGAQCAARSELGQLRSQVMTLENTVRLLREELRNNRTAGPTATSAPAASASAPAATTAKASGDVSKLKRPAAKAGQAKSAKEASDQSGPSEAQSTK